MPESTTTAKSPSSSAQASRLPQLRELGVISPEANGMPSGPSVIVDGQVATSKEASSKNGQERRTVIVQWLGGEERFYLNADEPLAQVPVGYRVVLAIPAEFRSRENKDGYTNSNYSKAFGQRIRVVEASSL